MTLHAKRRAVALLLVAVVLGVAGALLAHDSAVDAPATPSPPPGSAPGQREDPLRYRAADRAEFESLGAAGLAHVLYAKSPGGAIATAERVDSLREQIEQAAGDGKVVDADTLEGIVFLESGGRPDAMAGGTEGAVGLTQILAETGQNLLGMKVDVAASKRLTRGIQRGRRVAARERERRRVDERYDTRKALAATVRYLDFARGKLGDRLDLAVASYHMGVGNLQNALEAYGSGDVPYAQLFFDSTPLRNAKAWDVLGPLGDDSSTYLWRVRAAEEIMRLFRDDPQELERTAELQTEKNSAENLLRPEDGTEIFSDPGQLGDARADGTLVRLPTTQLREDGVRIDPQMGELAARVGAKPSLYRALRPEALAALQYIGRAVREISGSRGTLQLTSTARDEEYQKVLSARNIEATHAYSLHTTGYAFDIGRAYSSGAQAQAFQFVIDRLTALDVIAWVREPGAIHITVGPRAKLLLQAARAGA